MRTSPPSASRSPNTPAAATFTVQPEPYHAPGTEPTRHTYTVRPGDTLESVAVRFGVSTAALQEANGGLLPDVLTAGHVLLIPPPMSALATGTFARLLPTNTPLPLPLEPPACYDTPVGETFCLGWIANPLPGALVNVIVQVILRGAEGEPLAVATTPVTQAILPAREGAPYAARFPALPGFDHAEAILLSAEQVGAARPSAVPLTVIESESIPEGNAVRIRGTVRHDGDSPLADLLIVLTLLDGSGRVTGFRVLRVEGTLAPGQALPVDAQVTPLGGGTAQHHLYAEGRPVE